MRWILSGPEQQGLFSRPFAGKEARDGDCHKVTLGRVAELRAVPRQPPWTTRP